VRHEGINLVELLAVDRRHVLRELLLGLVLVLALVPALIVSQALGAVFYPGQLRG
jgi:hypothetical protein